MAKLIYNMTKSHGNNTNHLSGAGLDKIKIKIPSGQKFSHFVISQASGHTGIATFNVVKSPKVNATGDQEIHIMWTYGPFSKCKYSLKVYSVNSTDVQVKPIVVFGDNNWYNLAMGYLKQKKPFILRVQGPDATKLFSVINPIKTMLVARNITINDGGVTITIAICIAIVAVAGLSVLGAVLLYAINQGCTTKAEYDTNASVSTGTVRQIMDFEFMNCG